MRLIQNLSIRWKLVAITVVTCAIAELLAGGIATYYNGLRDMSRESQEATVQADELAASLAAPLAFGDSAAAQQYLDALDANREIAAAGAYGGNGSLFASFVRPGASIGLVPARAPPVGRRFGGATLTISLPVVQKANYLGRVYVVVDVEPMAARLANLGGLMLLTILGSLLVAAPLSMRLNASVTRAIGDIATAASRVTQGDLDVRLPEARGGDEIGVLVSTFGKMVESLRGVMQQERLRALGEMSSGIAHDINNALSPMALLTQSLLEREPDLSPNVRSYLETAKRVVDDVSATVGRMREFSRKRETEIPLRPVDLNALARQVIELTRARWNNIQQTLGSVIDIKTELAADLPAINGVEGEIREALTNLIFNAADAMVGGGTITLRTRRFSESSADYAVIEVADDGIGMDEETRRRCMEPFFTTKGERGTGLGLAMVYGMVQRHSAEIAIESAVGQGTKISMTFLAPTPVVCPDESAVPKAPVRQTPLRILLIDDDPFVLGSMEVVLGLDGHQIVTAEGGQSGIDKFRTAHGDGHPFDFVITDLGMSHVDGRQVARAVKDMSKSVRVILVTGWGRRMSANGETPECVDYLLGKPPKLEELRGILSAGAG